MKYANLTPHEVNLFRKDGSEIVIKPIGYVLRVPEEVEEIGEIDGIKVVKKKFVMNDVEKRDIVKKVKKFANSFDVIIVSLLGGQLVKKFYEEGLIDKEVIEKYYVIGNTVRDKFGRVVGADALARVIDL